MWSLRSEVFRRPWFRPEPFSFLAEREKEMDAIVVATKAKKRSEEGRLVVCFCTSPKAGNLRAMLLEFKKLFFQIEV